MKDKITVIVIGFPVREGDQALRRESPRPKEEKGRTKENGKDHYHL